MIIENRIYKPEGFIAKLDTKTGMMSLRWFTTNNDGTKRFHPESFMDMSELNISQSMDAVREFSDTGELKIY